MRFIKIANLKEIHQDSNILYQKYFEADALINFDKNEDNTIKFEFLVEMTPLDYNYYIKKIIGSDVDFKAFSNLVLPEIKRIHNEDNIINF